MLGTAITHADSNTYLLTRYLLRSVIEMQAFLGELVDAFQFDLPKEKIHIQKAVAGVGMLPIVRGKPELGATLPLRVSLAP